MINHMNSVNVNYSSVEVSVESDDEYWYKLCGGEFDDESANPRYSVEVFAPAGWSMLAHQWNNWEKRESVRFDDDNLQQESIFLFLKK